MPSERLVVEEALERAIVERARRGRRRPHAVVQPTVARGLAALRVELLALGEGRAVPLRLSRALLLVGRDPRLLTRFGGDVRILAQLLKPRSAREIITHPSACAHTKKPVMPSSP